MASTMLALASYRTYIPIEMHFYSCSSLSFMEIRTQKEEGMFKVLSCSVSQGTRFPLRYYLGFMTFLSPIHKWMSCCHLQLLKIQTPDGIHRYRCILTHYFCCRQRHWGSATGWYWLTYWLKPCTEHGCSAYSSRRRRTLCASSKPSKQRGSRVLGVHSWRFQQKLFHL